MTRFSVLFSLLLLIQVGSRAQLLPSAKYKLVWSDEFNHNGAPNAKNWNFEKGFVRNNELQYYQASNAVCSGGKLVIEARRDSAANPQYDASSADWRHTRQNINYTSASLKTSGLHSWKFGRFEMRGRFDVNAGLWPAFWTLGNNGEWPSCGEIDIMEYYQGKLLANIACGTETRYKAKWFSKYKLLNTFKQKDWAKRFHIWRMDWDDQAISLYVDDELLNSVQLSDLNNVSGTPVNPFKQPHYILLNLALGGDNGGNPNPAALPRKFEVDYVRVYQKQGLKE